MSEQRQDPQDPQPDALEGGQQVDAATSGQQADASTSGQQVDAVSGAQAASTDERSEVPSEDELARVAVPARVRRAPKFGVFIVTGMVVGALVGLLLTLLVGGDDGASDVAAGQGFISFLDGQGAIRAVMATAGALVGGFAGGGIAALADRRSRDPLR